MTKLTTGLNQKNAPPPKEDASLPPTQGTNCARRRPAKDCCNFTACDYVLMAFLIISGLLLIAGGTLRVLPMWANHKYSEEAMCRVVDIIEHGYTVCNECYDECGTPWYEEDDYDEYYDDYNSDGEDFSGYEDDEDDDYKKPEMMARKKRGFGYGKSGGCQQNFFPCIEVRVEKTYHEEDESSEEEMDGGRSSEEEMKGGRSKRHMQGGWEDASHHDGDRDSHGDGGHRPPRPEGGSHGGSHGDGWHRPPRPEGDIHNDEWDGSEDDDMDGKPEYQPMGDGQLDALREEEKMIATLYHNRHHMKTLEECSFNACTDDKEENTDRVNQWVERYNEFQRTQELFECFHEPDNHEQVIAFKGHPLYLLSGGLIIPLAVALFCITVLVLRRFCCNKKLATARASAPPTQSVYNVESAVVCDNDDDLPKKEGVPDISKDVDTWMTQLPIKQDTSDSPPTYKPTASRTTSLADMNTDDDVMMAPDSVPPTMTTLPPAYKKQDSMPDIM